MGEERRRMAGALIPWEVPYEGRMDFLFETRDGWDVTVEVGAGRVVERVHRVLFGMASERLRHLFQGQRVQMADVTPVTFRAFVRYLYLNEIEMPQQGEDNLHLPLLNFALQYDVPRLVGRLENAAVITLQNVLRMFDLAWNNLYGELARRCLQIIMMNAQELFETEEMAELSENALREILAQDGLRVEEELQVFNSVIRWGQAERRRRGIEAVPLGQTLARLLPLVRFPCLSMRQFSVHVVRDNNLLPLEDAVAVFLHFSLPHEDLPVAGLRFTARPRDYRKVIGRRNPSPLRPDMNFNVIE